jgi:hypothetical protein
MTPWHEEPICKKHKLETFDCHDNGLNDFLIRHALKSHQWGGLKTFLAVADDCSGTVIGFYSLGPVSIQTCRPDVAPWGERRREQAGFRLQYLAVDRRVLLRGLDGQLLLAAGRRCILASMEIGGIILFIAAANDEVASWYASYGAMPLLDMPRCLVLPLASIEAAVKGGMAYEEQIAQPFEPDF